MLKYVVPNWIATRSYFADTPESRTIISNNKTHQTILLEGISSDLYAYLAAAGEDLAGFAKSKNIEQTMPGFLESLQENKLLAISNDIDNYRGEAMPHSGTSNTAWGEKYKGNEQSIEATMADWCYKHGFLWSLFMEMTYKCNLKCVHCYNPKTDFNSQIGLKEAMRIIDDATAIGVFNLTLSGGESLLADDFMAILRYAKSKRMNVSLFTNGQLLYDKATILDEIVSLYPYRVGISIYSADSAIHDKITGVKGSFDKAIAALKRLKDSGINTEIKSVQLNESVYSWRETLELIRKFCTNASFDVTLTPTIDGDIKTWLHSVSDEMLMELFTDPDSPLYMGEAEEPPVPESGDGPCFAGIRTLLVNPVLDVLGCVSLPIEFGNLYSQSLADIWNEAVKEKKGKLWEWQNVSLSDFKDCFHEEYCRFCHFCPGMGMLEDKLFAKSVELCRISENKREAFYSLKEGKVDRNGQYR